MSSQKEWNFNFGIYANDDSFITAKKCEELFHKIVRWVEKNNFSCGGGFAPYSNNGHYNCFADEEEEFCNCNNGSAMVIMSRYGGNPLVCLRCNNSVSLEKLEIDIETTAKLQQWQQVYDSIDRLWLDSGAYESWASSELSNPNSDVHKRGFEVQKMMQKYGKFYYWWFQEVGSDKKPLFSCPKCDELLEKKDDRFICEKCLIVMQSEW